MITTMEIRKELLNYIVFGVLTTLINILTYQILSMAGVTTLIANGIAWLLSVLFAYITNRKYVFDSHSENRIQECLKFYGSRISTGILDMAGMWMLMDILHLNGMVSKFGMNVVVIVLNYIFSKVFVFKHKEER